MTIKSWFGKSVICCAALVAMFAAAEGKAQDDYTVMRTGKHMDDLFVKGGHITIDAHMMQDMFAAGDHVEVSGVVEGDAFAAGGRLDLRGDVNGSLLAVGGRVAVDGKIDDGVVIFGGNVDLDGAIDGDVLVAGGDVDVTAAVAGDVRGSAGFLSLHRTISGNVLVSGGKVEIRDSALIKGKATIGAGTLYIGGHIQRGLKAAAREIIIAGVIDGNVKLIANEITLLPSARIGGDLIYRSPQEIKFDDAGQVGGDVTYIQSEEMRRGMGALFVFAGATHILAIVGMIIVVALVILIAPPLLPTLDARMRQRKWKALGLGLAFLIGMPIVMSVLTVTAIGLPLALIMGLLYILINVTGLLGGAYALGQKIFALLGQDFRATMWKQVAAASVGLLFWGLITLVPVLGGLIFILMTAFGVGALLSEGYTLCRGRQLEATG